MGTLGGHDAQLVDQRITNKMSCAITQHAFPDEATRLGGLAPASSSGITMRSSALTLRQMRYFAQVAEEGNITRAAESLHIAQPALSLSIRQLEAVFGTPLLQRHSRGVELTPAGDLLYRRIRVVSELLDQTVKEVSALGGEATNFLAFGMPSSLVLLTGTEAVVNAAEMLPGFSFSLREDPSFVLVDAVESRELDLAFAYRATEQAGVRLEPVMLEDLLLVTHADQAKQGDTITLEEALAYTFAFGGRRDAGRCTMEQAVAERGLTIETAYEMRSIAGIREIILQGMAASVLPYGAVAKELKEGTLAARRIVDPVLTQTMYIVRPAKGVELSTAHETQVKDYLMNLVNLIVERQNGLARKLP